MDVVVVSNQCRHEGPSQPVHQIVKRLRADHRVLFVEGNHSLGKMALSLLGKPYAFAPFGRFRVEEEGRFFVLTPPPRLPFRHFSRAIGRLQQAILRAAVRRGARRAGVESPILWSFVHQTAGLVGSLGERLAVYHCVDPWGELIEAAGLGRREVVLEDERETARRSDVVFATAAALRDDLLPHNRSTHYVPNAVDAEAVLESIRRMDPDRDALAPLGRPRIGFVGAPERKVDADLLAEVARRSPQWTFVIVGPLRNFPGRRRLKRLSNVALLGPVPARAVPATLSALDVAIIPFAVDALTRGVSPLKLFEYLAAGLPVVSTPIPEVADLRDVVRIAPDAAGFMAEIAAALEEKDDAERLRQRIEAALRNTWDHRVADVARILETKLRTTSPGPVAREGRVRDRVAERALR
jgi:glycosyltransferase involved in cell wall biosynthesis